MWKIEKVNAFIKKELGSIILKELDIFPGILLTITRVECSSNLIEAKVFVSVIPDDKTDEVFSLLQRNIFFLQQKLNKKLRIRPVPKIRFLKESQTARASNVEKLLKDIGKN
ncbi:MAG: 30S ribosome-binding factor RbfA [Candidatus Paceibacterota bacterium]|jgi:ribosome-binding factor A|nr:30S ribosome-binding factor RbfA [Candidatus Paceibacterota bacterium]MDD5555377.1 30S ribosome-binding factor RbfA [Candidatus Paceibacterota bacterium]